VESPSLQIKLRGADVSVSQQVLRIDDAARLADGNGACDFVLDFTELVAPQLI
jgi:hypothetical protein